MSRGARYCAASACQAAKNAGAKAVVFAGDAGGVARTARSCATVVLKVPIVITASQATFDPNDKNLQAATVSMATPIFPFTETDDITNSGEHLGGVIGPVDFTTHFSTNWTGTSMTCDMQVLFDTTTGTANYENVNAVLYITYEYDDSPSTNTTQIKTVAIPFESITGNLPDGNPIVFAKQPPLGGAGGNPIVYVQFTNGSGTALSAPIKLGRCVQL